MGMYASSTTTPPVRCFSQASGSRISGGGRSAREMQLTTIVGRSKSAGQGSSMEDTAMIRAGPATCGLGVEVPD